MKQLLDLLNIAAGLILLTICGTGLACVAALGSLYLFYYDIWLYVTLPGNDWSRLHLGAIALICIWLGGWLALRALDGLWAKRHSSAYLILPIQAKPTYLRRFFKGKNRRVIIIR